MELTLFNIIFSIYSIKKRYKREQKLIPEMGDGMFNRICEYTFTFFPHPCRHLRNRLITALKLLKPLKLAISPETFQPEFLQAIVNLQLPTKSLIILRNSAYFNILYAMPSLENLYIPSIFSPTEYPRRMKHLIIRSIGNFFIIQYHILYISLCNRDIISGINAFLENVIQNIIQRQVDLKAITFDDVTFFDNSLDNIIKFWHRITQKTSHKTIVTRNNQDVTCQDFHHDFHTATHMPVRCICYFKNIRVLMCFYYHKFILQ